ncbi:MAG: fructose-6-phosphate aldolase [candidate division WOR-3 bacterium]|nr:fructose-6-phosphate aldolase [candidate division WOR-3 bacterium]
MKIFIDSADVKEIREVASWGILDGVTTNPTLVAKTGREIKECVTEICQIVDGPISVEVISTEVEGMVKEAEDWARINPKNITIKIPMGTEGLKAVKILKTKNIKTNVTLVFSPNQAILAAKAGATFISPFVGRLDDISHFGMDIVGDIVQIFNNYGFETEIIVASVRNPLHVVEAARMGAHIATVPFAVLKQMVGHPLTDIGIKKFFEDYQKIPKR